MNDVLLLFDEYYYALGQTTAAKHRIALHLGVNDDPMEDLDAPHPDEVYLANRLVAYQVLNGASFPGWNVSYAQGYLGVPKNVY